MNYDKTISSAVCIFVGRGISPYPKEDGTRLREAFGAELAADLEPRIRLLLDELDQIKPDWKTHTLESASKSAAGDMKTKHPELDEKAVAALEWIYSWWWK
jgi:hypothetical protein